MEGGGVRQSPQGTHSGSETPLGEVQEEQAIGEVMGPVGRPPLHQAARMGGLTCRDTEGTPGLVGRSFGGALQTGSPRGRAMLPTSSAKWAETKALSSLPRAGGGGGGGHKFPKSSVEKIRGAQNSLRLECPQTSRHSLAAVPPRAAGAESPPGMGGKRRLGSHRRRQGSRPSRRGSAGRRRTAAQVPRRAGRGRRARGAARRASRSRARRCRRRSPPRRRSASPGARTRRCRTRCPRGRRAALQGHPR